MGGRERDARKEKKKGRKIPFIPLERLWLIDVSRRGISRYAAYFPSGERERGEREG